MSKLTGLTKQGGLDGAKALIERAAPKASDDTSIMSGDYEKLSPRSTAQSSQSLVETLVANLKAAMTAQKLTQNEMARRGSMPQTTIGRVLSGDTAPTLDTLAGLADALGVSPASLIDDGFDPSVYKQSDPPHLLAKQVSRLVEDFMLCDARQRQKILELARKYSEDSQ
ncbi:MAG: helix-turn-helix transcriptional regulator [Rhodocyclaceae bacterium]|nr:helix-turn-helix transcriptional regulator [Rhodocyclaceae bacterium]